MIDVNTSGPAAADLVAPRAPGCGSFRDFLAGLTPVDTRPSAQLFDFERERRRRQAAPLRLVSSGEPA